MSKRPAEKISKRMVDALSAHGRPGVYWDRDLPGFGVRLYPTGRTTYVVQSRGPTGSRRVTVGQHGAISAEQARKAAAAIIDRIKAGEDPIPEVAEPGREPTVADLAERYLRTHVAVQGKASSMSRYRQLLHHHILPALGEMPVGSVERKHAAALHYALRDRPGTANPVLWVLSKMFSLADRWRCPRENIAARICPLAGAHCTDRVDIAHRLTGESAGPWRARHSYRLFFVFPSKPIRLQGDERDLAPVAFLLGA